MYYIVRYDTLKDLDMPMPTPEEIKQWIEIDGKSMNSLAKEFKCNVGGLSAMMKRLGIISRHVRKAKSKDDLDGLKLLAQYKNNVSLHQLMKQTGRPIRAIKNALLKAEPSLEFRTRNDALRPKDLNTPESLDAFAKSGKTARQIANELGVKEKTVVDAYKRLNLSRYKKPSSVIIPKAELQKLYIDDQFSSILIANLYGTSAGRVCTMLKDYKIERRGFGGKRKSKFDKLNSREWLFDQYITKAKSAADIQRIVDCGIGTVIAALNRHQIPLRSRDEVYNKLRDDDHGRKIEVLYRGELVKCDSVGESEFLSFAERTNLAVKRATENIKIGKHLYRPDFITIDDSTIIEVKPKSQIIGEAHDRQNLVRQFSIATKSGYKFKAWAQNQLFDLALNDFDKYYATSWDLFFESDNDCADWLIDFGFHGALRSHGSLVSGLKRFEAIVNDGRLDLFDSSINAAETVWFMRHFYPHYFHSTHLNYKPVSTAFEIGNSVIVRNAMRKIWTDGKPLNIYSLLQTINKEFVDFTMVSMFKPWVARAVYLELLNEGDTVIDPCSGWGGRALGTMNLPIIYRGFDINDKSVNGTNQLIKFVGSKRIADASVEVADSSIKQFPESDLIFTSPPYHDTEIYHGTPMSDKTCKIISNIFKQRSAPLIALNVSNKMANMVTQIASANKYKYENTLLMKTRQFMAMRQTVTEPILIYRASK